MCVQLFFLDPSYATSHVGGKMLFVLLGTISARDNGDSYGSWVAAVFRDFLCFTDCLRCVWVPNKITQQHTLIRVRAAHVTRTKR